jgi:hypothetical protein
MAGIQGRKDGRQEPQRRFLPFCISGLNFCLSALLPFCVATVFLSACSRAKAKTVPDAPLDVPAPPPRDVETADTEPPPPVPLAQEPARNTPPRTRTNTPPPREQPRTEQTRPEPSRPEIPSQPAAEPPKPAEEAPKPPATTLQTTPPTAEGELERAISAALAKATTDLNRIDYRRLNNDARTQYDTAKRFIRQTEEAMHARNLVYAKNLADKAATIAAQLAGR